MSFTSRRAGNTAIAFISSPTPFLASPNIPAPFGMERFVAVSGDRLDHESFQMVNGFGDSNPAFSENIHSPPAARDAQHVELTQGFGKSRVRCETITHWFQSEHSANQEQRRSSCPGLRATCCW